MRLSQISPRRLAFSGALLCALAVSVAISCAAQAGVQSNSLAAPRIVSKIDESRLVTLTGTKHPLANARNDRGAAPDNMQLDRMHLVLTRSASQESSLRQTINDLHTPGTASYHKWLTPDEFGKQFGPSDQDIATVEAWLNGHGFNVTKVNPGKQTIEFSGNAGQFRNAFHAQIHQYAVNGETHYANANDPQIPAALAPVVGGFVSLNNFRPKPYVKSLGKAEYNRKTDQAKPLWTTGSSTAGFSFVLSPADYAVQYNLQPLYDAKINGAGQTIAIVNESNINVDLVNQFRSLFSLTANPPQVIIDGNDPGIDGVNNPDGPNNASIEAYLDVEWAGAVAPAATIDLVIAADTALENGLYLAAQRAVYSNVAPVISVSFGNCEFNLGTTNAFLNSLWEQAAAQGITVMVSTGDAGSAGCDNDNTQEYAVNGQAVNGFASTPFNVAVGGTDFYYSAFSQGLTAMENQIATYWNTTPSNNTPAVSIQSVIPEQPWNASQYGLTLATLQNGAAPPSTSIASGGGGASNCALGTYNSSGATVSCTGGYTKPSWQLGVGDNARDLPDVSLFASSGSNASFYAECYQDGDCQPVSSGGTVQISGVGGTSAAAPSFAGIMALVNQQYGRQGQANFVLYPLAKQFPASFHDVAAGTNSVPCDITDSTPNCIPVSNPVTVQVTDSNGNTVNIKEGQIGTGTTPEYNATAGYDLASGLGTVDANQLVSNWNKVTFASSGTTLTASPTTITHGSSIAISGTVTGNSPTGDVALMTSSTVPGQQGQTFFTLNSSSAYSGNVSLLPGGTYNIWAQYGGDSNNAASSSPPVQITVSQENSTLNFNMYSANGTYTASSTPGTSVDYGTQLLLSAQPVPGTSSTSNYTVPTGTVAFSDGSTVLNTAVLNAIGDAEYNAPFAVGTHSVTASYSGDQSYNKSSAAAISFTVVKDTPQLSPTATFFTSGGNVINGPGQPTVLTMVVQNNAQVSAHTNTKGLYPVSVAAPTGTVNVTGLPSGTNTSSTLTAGVDPVTGAVEGIATFTIPAGAASNNYNATFSYTGDSNYNAVPASSQTTFTIPIVNPVSGGLLASATTATVTGSISPTSNVVVTGTVTGQSGHAAPTGQVALYAGGYYLTQAGLGAGNGFVAPFSAVINSRVALQGANTITVQYLGDTTYAQSAYTLNGGTPISNPLSDFTLVPETTIVPVTAGSSTGGSVTINLASVNGFSGNVNLTCTAAAGVTCSIPSSESLASGGGASATVTINAPSASANGSYNVSITGTDSATSKFIHTLNLQAQVSGSTNTTQGIALSNSGNITVTAGANTGNTSTITVTPSGGFTGLVNLSCAVTTSPSGATTPATCSIPSPLDIAGTSAVSVNVFAVTTATTTAGAYVITVTGKDAVTGNLTSSTTVNLTVNPAVQASFALSANPATVSVTPGATSGNTSTITITPSNGFTAAVNLSCAVTTSISNPTSPATCSLASPSVSSAPWTDVLTVTTTSTTTAGSYTVTVTGTSGSITQTVQVTLNVGTFSLSANPTTLTVTAGATTGNTSTITVAPQDGFTQTVNLACAVTTSISNPTDPATCSLASLSVASGSGTDVLTVTTTAATNAMNRPSKLFWPSAGGAVLALLVFFGIPARKRNWQRMLCLFLLFVSAAGMGCGGGGGNKGGGNTGTTPGTYTVTVTGTSGSITMNTTVTLTVQ